MVKVEDFTLNYDSLLKNLMKKVMVKIFHPLGLRRVIHKSRIEENSKSWIKNISKSRKPWGLKQKVDSTMDEVEVLKNKETTEEQELQPVIKSEKSGDEEDVEFVDM